MFWFKYFYVLRNNPSWFIQTYLKLLNAIASPKHKTKKIPHNILMNCMCVAKLNPKSLSPSYNHFTFLWALLKNLFQSNTTIDNIFLSYNLGGTLSLFIFAKRNNQICCKRSHYIKGLKSEKLCIFVVEM
jgi:hypothetical protein